MREELEDAANEVHNELGPNWSESIYHRALEHELSERGIPLHSEVTLSVMYKGAAVGRRRPDLILTDGDMNIVVELKAGSNSGRSQLEEYIQIIEDDENYQYLRGGAVIRFNEECEFEFIELGPKSN